MFGLSGLSPISSEWCDPIGLKYLNIAIRQLWLLDFDKSWRILSIAALVFPYGLIGPRGVPSDRGKNKKKLNVIDSGAVGGVPAGGGTTDTTTSSDFSSQFTLGGFDLNDGKVGVGLANPAEKLFTDLERASRTGNRIKKINEWMNQVILEYPPINIS